MTDKIEISPETYEKKKEEFKELGLAFQLYIPTQEQIDKWKKQSSMES